jgi:hypothetical protein
MIALVTQNGRIYVDVSGLPDEEWIPTAGDRFVSVDRAASFRAIRNANGDVEVIEWTSNNATRRIPRIGPLFPTSSSASDPDPAFTANIMAVLGQFAQGDTAVTKSKLLTEGARKVFNVANPTTGNVSALTFVLAQDVAGRGIERHGHPIARVMHYRMRTPQGERLLLVHLDANGLVADYD